MAAPSGIELIDALESAMSVQVEIVRRLMGLPPSEKYDPILDSLIDFQAEVLQS